MIPTEHITGLILAGGRGQRLGGVDKGLQPWRGKALVDHALERLAPQVGTVLVSANRNVADYAARGLRVLADEVELGRIISNLLENARRYGKSVDSGIANISIAAIAREKWVLIKIRDRGLGVAPEQLANLTQPFFRGEAARTAANGAGLGLAIVEKTVSRMGGSFALANGRSGGLSANIRLQRATKT